MSSSTLTDEQRARIARNKEEALRRRAARLEREKAVWFNFSRINQFFRQLWLQIQLSHRIQQLQEIIK